MKFASDILLAPDRPHVKLANKVKHALGDSPVLLPGRRGLQVFSAAAVWLPSALGSLTQWLEGALDGPWMLDTANTGDDRILSGGPGLQQGQCLSFDGVNDYVDMPTALRDIVVPGGTWSVAWYMKPTLPGAGFRNAWGCSNGATKRAGVSVTSTGAIQVSTYDGITSVNASGTVVDDAWVHVAVVCTAGVLTMWLDSVLQVGTTGASITVGTAFRVGSRTHGFECLDADMFDFRVFNDALTSNEITYLRTFGASGDDPGTANQKGFFKFDEQSGTMAYDSSGNGNDATLVNGVAHGTQDIYSWHNNVGYYLSGAVFVPRDESDTDNDVLGNPLTYAGAAPLHGQLASPCGTFDGVDDYATVPHSTDFNVSVNNAFSFAFRIVMGSTGNHYIIDKQQAGNKGFYCLFLSGNLQVGLPDGTAWNSHNFTTGLVNGTTYGVQISYDGTNLSVYLNGLHFQTDVDARTLIDSTVDLEIGKWTGGGLNHDGQLYDIQIFNDALTADEALWIDSGGQLGTDPTDANLMASWPISENAGPTIHDVSGNGNHGTATNVTLANFWANNQTEFAYGCGNGYGGAMYLDGVDDDVSVPGLPVDTFSSDFRVEFEIAISESAGYVLCHNQSKLLFGYGTGAAGKMSLGNTSGGVNFVGDAAGKWVVVHDTSETGFDRWKCYRNGIELVADSTFGSYLQSTDDAADIIIGRRTSGAPFFGGGIRNYKIYDGLLDSDPLVGQWDLIDGTADDSSGNGYDGVLNGAVPMYLPSLADGNDAATGDPITHPASAFNGASTLDHDPYTVPKLAPGNLDGMTVPAAHALGDPVVDATQHFLRDLTTSEDRFLIFKESLTGDDLANTQAYVA